MRLEESGHAQRMRDSGYPSFLFFIVIVFVFVVPFTSFIFCCSSLTKQRHFSSVQVISTSSVTEGDAEVLLGYIASWVCTSSSSSFHIHYVLRNLHSHLLPPAILHATSLMSIRATYPLRCAPELRKTTSTTPRSVITFETLLAPIPGNSFGPTLSLLPLNNLF